MGVKAKDRSEAQLDAAGQARALTHQVLILTRTPQLKEDGTWSKAGILGAGQAYDVFGRTLLQCSLTVHGHAFQGCSIKLDTSNSETVEQRAEYFNRGIDQCNAMLRLLDLCVFEYAQNNQKKKKSFQYLTKLIINTRESLKNRIYRDKSLYGNKQNS